jgi:TonB family protein
VEKLDLKPDALRIQGHRVGFTREKKTSRIMLIAQRKEVGIEIHLETPLQSLDEAQTILDRIFYLKDENLEHAKPEYRRSDDLTAGEPIYSVKDGITHPIALYTPEPEFSEEARQAKYQGLVTLNIVVDKAGSVAGIRLVKAVGYGLDENAMEGVKKWRFRPAMHDGQPVAVGLNIEVSFKLY